MAPMWARRDSVLYVLRHETSASHTPSTVGIGST